MAPLPPSNSPTQALLNTALLPPSALIPTAEESNIGVLVMAILAFVLSALVVLKSVSG